MDSQSDDRILADLGRNWIWIPDWQDCPLGGDRDTVGRQVHFRRRFHVPIASVDPSPLSSIIRLSADTRYKLLVNGKRACIGPARGFHSQWYYDTVDIGPLLKGGENVIDVVVVRYYPGLNAAVPFPRCRRPGLTVLGSIGGEDLSTGGIDTAWQACLIQHVSYPLKPFWDIFLNIFEDVRPCYGLQSDRWMRPLDYRCRPFAGSINDWDLHPRMIPLAEESPCVFKCVRDSQGHVESQQWHNFFLGCNTGPLTLLANTTHRVELEFEAHSTAYIRLVAQRPRWPGSMVKLTYSEAYETLPRPKKAAPQKHNRTKREGNALVGPSDTYTFTGGSSNVGNNESFSETESYEPFFWKTFRFIVFQVQVDADPLVLEEIDFTQTNYPLHVLASWEVADTTQDAMWQISLRTMRNCMFDGYNDCPFYEQLQYGEDSRSAMLFHYLVSGDDRLARQAIVAFAASLRPDGLLKGNFPSTQTQIIPGFSLFWVMAVCDHMLYFGDLDFISRHLPTVDAILGYYERMTDHRTGLVSRFPLKYWSFIDWNIDWPYGHPPFPPGDEKPLSFFTMLYGYTLQRAATLLRQAGRESFAHEYLTRAKRSSTGIRQHCFDGHVFTDTLSCIPLPGSEGESQSHSQVAQVWGILCGAFDLGDQDDRRQARRLLSMAFAPDTRFSVCSYPMLHYAFRALAMAGLYDEHYHSMWRPWHQMLAKNLTTWEEDNVNSRSDCHQWSSLPIYEYLAEVTGLTPLEPGWTTIEFAPRIRLYRHLCAHVAMGKTGVACVEWNTEPAGKEEFGGRVEDRTDHQTASVVTIKLKLPCPIRVLHKISIDQVKDCGIISELHYRYFAE